jgi:hypothetical protein
MDYYQFRYTGLRQSGASNPNQNQRFSNTEDMHFTG